MGYHDKLLTDLIGGYLSKVFIEREDNMPRRPLIITLIVICYLLAPAAVIIQASIINRIPILGPHNIFTRLFFTDYIILSVYPIGAFALYSVKRWGWYLFLGCSLILIVYNIVAYLFNPRYNLFLLLLFNVLLALVAGIFFRKHIIAPYFNPRLRWWETEPRFKIEIKAEIIMNSTKLSGEILDISNSGCFIELDQYIKIGKIYNISIKCMHHFTEVKGKVMRKSSSKEEYTGYGLMYVNMTPVEKSSINTIIEDLEKAHLRNYARDIEMALAKGIETKPSSGLKKTAPRYRVNHTVVLTKEGKTIQCPLVDISRNGCFITTRKDIIVDALYSLKIRCVNREADVKGKIMRKSEQYGIHGYGIMFKNVTKPEKRKIDSILHTIKMIGARDRLESVKPVAEEVIDKSVTNTPYKVILFFRRLLLRDVG